MSVPSLQSLPAPLRKRVQDELLAELVTLGDVAKDLHVDMNGLWRVYLAKADFNQYDTRERRHIMHTSNEEKAKLAVELNQQLKAEYTSVRVDVMGFDVQTQTSRKLNRETEYPLAVFSDLDRVKALSAMVPPYIKLKASPIVSGRYLVNTPEQCISQFPDATILLAPNKTTVMVASAGKSVPGVDMKSVGDMMVAFMDAGTAEQIDDDHPHEFWFYENYATKRKYHFIYSNARLKSTQ